MGSLFLETIKLKDGKFYNLPLHVARFQRTVKQVFNVLPDFKLTEDMIPHEFRQGLVKCRVLYSAQILSIEFSAYSFKVINRLKIVEDNNIEYNLKSADRKCLDELLSKKDDADEILIVKNNCITDTSFSNVVLEDKSGNFFTPKSYLLAGTKRQQLLNEKKIQEKDILLDDISNYNRIYLINAMIDLEDEVCVLSLSTQ